MALHSNQFVETVTTKVIHIHLDDDIIDAIRGEDNVLLQLKSKAMNREPTLIKLNYLTIQRLTVDRT